MTDDETTQLIPVPSYAPQDEYDPLGPEQLARLLVLERLMEHSPGTDYGTVVYMAEWVLYGPARTDDPMETTVPSDEDVP